MSLCMVVTISYRLSTSLPSELCVSAIESSGIEHMGQTTRGRQGERAKARLLNESFAYLVEARLAIWEY